MATATAVSTGLLTTVVSTGLLTTALATLRGVYMSVILFHICVGDCAKIM